MSQWRVPWLEFILSFDFSCLLLESFNYCKTDVKDASDAEGNSNIQTDDINKKFFPRSNSSKIDV